MKEKFDNLFSGKLDLMENNEFFSSFDLIAQFDFGNVVKSAINIVKLTSKRHKSSFSNIFAFSRFILHTF